MCDARVVVVVVGLAGVWSPVGHPAVGACHGVALASIWVLPGAACWCSIAATAAIGVLGGSVAARCAIAAALAVATATTAAIVVVILQQQVQRGRQSERHAANAGPGETGE